MKDWIYVIFKTLFVQRCVTRSFVCWTSGRKGVLFSIYFDMMTKWSVSTILSTSTMGPGCNWSQINNRVYIRELYLVIIFITNNCTWFVCWKLNFSFCIEPMKEGFTVQFGENLTKLKKLQPNKMFLDEDKDISIS